MYSGLSFSTTVSSLCLTSCLLCLFNFYPPHCFHPFRLFKEPFLKHAVYITVVTFTLSSLLFHCPLCRGNPGQRNVIHYLAGLQVSILDFCAGMLAWSWKFLVCHISRGPITWWYQSFHASASDRCSTSLDLWVHFDKLQGEV